MPFGYKNSTTLAVEIIMTRMVHDGAILVLEGSDDLRFWQIWKNEDCEMVDGEGKSNVVGVVKELTGESLSGVLCIIDDDYDSLLGITYECDNLVVVDAHDLECLLCQTSALERLLAVHGNASKIRKFVEDEGDGVRAALLKRSLSFGRLRWVMERDALALRADVIRVARFVSRDTWDVDYEGLIVEVTGDAEDDKVELSARIANLPDADPWRIVRGHDVIEVLRLGLREVLGELKTSVGSQEIFRVLCAGAPGEDLQATRLWKDIQFWEVQNGPYLILRR